MTRGSTVRGRAAVDGPPLAAPMAAGTRPLHLRRSVLRFVLLAVAILVAPLAATACGSSTAATGSSGDGLSTARLTVFAAASLTDAFTELGHDFTASHPNVEVSFDFAGSNDLVAQIQQGAPADVFASADTANMNKAGDLVDTPRIFAGNKLAIAVPPGNPKHIRGLDDLGRSDLKVVLAAPEVPAGAYAREILGQAGVIAKPVSLEVTVKGVVTKVALGEADAGIVYVTDVTAAKGEIDSVPIPAAQNVLAGYPIATVVRSANAAGATAFVDYVVSAQGQRTMQKYGFLPAPTP